MVKDKPYFKEKKEKECEECKRLRHDLTWKGSPPKCYKHRKKGWHIYRWA